MKKIFKYITVLLILLSCIGCSSAKPSKSIEDVIYEGAKLSTLEVVMNVVAEHTNDPKIGFDKKYWIEYTEHVDLGINLDDVSIETNNDEVIVDLPDVTVTHSSVGEILDENIVEVKFIIANVTEEQKIEAKRKAEENALAKALESDELVTLAEDRAKAFIEGLVGIYNDQNETKYTIVWK